MGYAQSKDYQQLALHTFSPSDLNGVITSSTTAIFGLINLMQIHYLRCGHQGMLYRRQLFPNITRMTPYQYLLAAVVNNFGTFLLTLVIKKKIQPLQAGLVNAMSSLITLLNFALFVVRFNHEENVISSTFLTQCNAQ